MKEDLRKLAKERLEEKRLVVSTSEADALKLVEELGIHQEELLIQNEELKRIQGELEDSRAKYFELYDLAPVGYITLTKELIIKESNLVASNLLGIDRGAIINKGLSSFVSPKSQESFYLHFRRLANGHESQIHQIMFRRDDGKEIHVQLESNLVSGVFGVGFRSILTDITEHEKTERFAEGLNNINSRISSSFNFEEIMDHVVISASRAMNGAGTTIFMKKGDGWVIKYQHNVPPTINHLPVGDRLVKMFNLTAETRDIISVRDAQGDSRTYNRSAQIYVLKSAISAPLIVGGEVIGILGFSYFDEKMDFSQAEIDFTRKLASSISLALSNARLYEAISISEAKYRGLFENLREAVSLNRLIFDGCGSVIDAEVIDMNPSALREIGDVSIESMRGKKVSEVFSPKMAEMALAKTRELMISGTPISEVMRSDIDDRFYLTTFLLIGKEHTIVTSIDVTVQKQLQEELKRSNTDLQQFAYVASHDLKEPLRMITSYLQLLEKINMGKLDATSKEYMHFATDGAQRMRVMIDDLLAYAQVATNSKPFTSVNMNEVLAITLNDLRVGIKESGASVTTEELPTVMADQQQMVLLLNNLVGNAIKYRVNVAPQICLRAYAEGNEWIFSIQDNGIGIDPKHQERIFQIFQRLHTQEEYDGTGIGLAISKRIVERLGGRIWVESEEGKGATFFFTIPKKDQIPSSSIAIKLQYSS